MGGEGRRAPPLPHTPPAPPPNRRIGRAVGDKMGPLRVPAHIACRPPMGGVSLETLGGSAFLQIPMRVRTAQLVLYFCIG